MILGKEQMAEKCKTAIEAVAWAVLRAKLAHLKGSSSTGNAVPLSDPLEDLFSFLGLSHSASGSIPSSILVVAPHLGKLSSQIKSDTHLDETWKYHNTFNKSGMHSSIVTIGQTCGTSPLVDLKEDCTR